MSNDVIYSHEETYKGFLIRFEALVEYEQPDWDFESEEERKELLEKIDNYLVMWFCAKVTALKVMPPLKNGNTITTRQPIELGTDYLVGCCYNSYEEFLADDCYKYMRDQAIEYAKQAIFDLNKGE